MMKWHPKVLGLSFWLGILVCLVALVFVFVRFLTGASSSSSDAASASSHFSWLLTLGGERRGFVIISDLTQDIQSWELWGPGQGMARLSPLDTLRPDRFFKRSGFGFNGGFWDEARQPVGVCAGERGIHGARAHAGGFALAGGRAWIGALTPRVRLTDLGRPGASGRLLAATSRTQELALNPALPPRRAPFLVDPATFSGEVQAESRSAVLWLELATPVALHFNTTVTLKARKLLWVLRGGTIPLPPRGMLALVLPEREKDPQEPPPHPGDRFQLALGLEPVHGVVRLATCAGPRLIKGGKISEALGQVSDPRAERTWRTAVGCDDSGHRLVVVMLARGKDGLPGVTLRETAQTLAALGATDAVNLDGGSSSSVLYARCSSELHPLFPLQSEIHHGIFLRKELAVTTREP